MHDRSGEQLSHPLFAAVAILVILGGIGGIASANMTSEGLRADSSGNGAVPSQLFIQPPCIQGYPRRG